MSFMGRRGTESGRRGAAAVTAVVLLVVAVLFALCGFYIGRNVLGEQYLKLGASKIRRQPMPYVPPSRGAAPPVVEEPESVIEPAPTEELRPLRTRRSAARPAPTSEQAPAPAGTLTLRLGTFLKPENAKVLVQDLRNRGYSPTVAVEKQGQSELHRVQLGPLSPNDARALASDLQRQGYDVGVVENK